jgi:hypothetical protein
MGISLEPAAVTMVVNAADDLNLNFRLIGKLRSNDISDGYEGFLIDFY